MTSLVASFSKCHAKTFEKLELSLSLYFLVPPQLTSWQTLGEKMAFSLKIERDYLEIREGRDMGGLLACYSQSHFM